MAEIAFVTDSTSDIPVGLAQAHQISVVPNFLIMDGESLEDGVTITRQEFYERLPGLKAPATTATPSSASYHAVYEELFKKGADTIISIHVSSKLSGIYNSACLGASEFGDRVKVLDGGQLTMGTGFQLLGMAEAAERGASIEEVLDIGRDIQKRVSVIAMLDTLEYVRRSGRVSWARARLGELLQVKPFVEVKNGEVFSRGEARTRTKGIERLKELLSNHFPVEQLAILHSNAEEDALRFASSLPFQPPYTPPIINVTPIIGTHVGPNALGFAVVVKNTH